jgi:DNA-binding MarR family transcriptional regulator
MQTPVNQKSCLSAAEGAAWGGFLRTHATLVRQLDAELQAAHRLSLSAFEVLLFLRAAPDEQLRMFELSTQLLLSFSGTSRLVDRMVSEELITRKQVEHDRRGNYVVLTQRGRLMLDEAEPTHVQGVRHLFLSHLTGTELQVLGEVWQKVERGE